MDLPLCGPFFISLLPAVGLTLLMFLSLFTTKAQVRIASIVIVLSMAITSLIMPAVAIPLAVSLVGVIPLNLIQGRNSNHAG
jgi:hypothetical protein